MNSHLCIYRTSCSGNFYGNLPELLCEKGLMSVVQMSITHRNSTWIFSEKKKSNSNCNSGSCLLPHLKLIFTATNSGTELVDIFPKILLIYCISSYSEKSLNYFQYDAKRTCSSRFSFSRTWRKQLEKYKRKRKGRQTGKECKRDLKRLHRWGGLRDTLSAWSLVEEGHVYADGISLTWLPLALALNITPRASESGSVTAELAQRHGFQEWGLQKWSASHGEKSETLGFGSTVAPTNTFQSETDMWLESGCNRPNNKHFHHLSRQVTVTQFDCTGLRFVAGKPNSRL